MEIISVSLHDLRKMNDSDGLVLQGCGGDLKEWVDGINDMLDIGKLAMWRLQTHELFGGTWLSDYVPNRLGGFVLCEEECDESEEMGMEMM